MVADAKLRAIRAILSNETYETTSGFYQNLEAALNRLPLTVLNDLSLIIDLKISRAVERAQDEARPPGALR